MLIHYFAYGSNMLTARLVERCGTARSINAAFVEGFALAFSKVSKDGSGKATLVQHEQSTVHGVLFSLHSSELPKLDALEGLGKGYDRIEVDVVTDRAPSKIVAHTYIATKMDDDLVPFDWYLGLVVAGARDHVLPDDYTYELSANAFQCDRCLKRKRRLEALQILSESGHSDWPSYLK